MEKSQTFCHISLIIYPIQNFRPFSRPQSSNLFLAGGRSYRQPKRFHNLSHCSQVVTTSSCDSENTTKEEVELEERLDNKEITEDECSKQSKESERKESLINSKKESEKKVSQSPPVQNVSESEAERLLVSIVGTTDRKRLMEITSSLSEWFDLRRCTTTCARDRSLFTNNA